MADTSADVADMEKKSSKMPLVLGLFAALLGGAGGFYATYSGMFWVSESPRALQQVKETRGPLTDVAFVEMDPIIVSLGAPSENQHLQFRAQLEVPSRHAADVTTLMPRVTDVLNGYLRALEPRDIERTSALTRLRAQMLRRVQIVAGADRVKDLLIMEFVVN